MTSTNPAAYLAALPPQIQHALVHLVRGIAGLSIDEKDRASTLALEVAKTILAEEAESPVALPFGVLSGTIQEIWARSVSFAAGEGEVA